MQLRHGDRMNTWLTTDWHFGHNMLVDKGYRPPNYGVLIAERLLHAVQPGDSVICLGDVFFYPPGRNQVEDLLNQLAGKRVRTVLTPGNHDRESQRWYLKQAWSWVCNEMVLHYQGNKVYFSHAPVIPYSDVDYLNIHGHLHAGMEDHRGGILNDGRHILISQEHLDYRPITLDRVLQLRKTPVFRNGYFRAL